MLPYQSPWPVPKKEDCYFYHSMTYPDGEEVSGSWDIRGLFSQYIGEYPIAGKTLLDIGTASGFLSFSAERAGAIVTGMDAATALEFRWLPVDGGDHFERRKQWREDFNLSNLIRIKNSWWYGWHKFQSKSRVVYEPLEALYDWDERFDIVLAGAIVEHLSDPIVYIGGMARVAKKTVIIAFTEVVDSDEPFMRPLYGLNPQIPYLWWAISRGLYVKLFDNLGFDVTFTTARAFTNDPNGKSGSGRAEGVRPTLIATRR